MYAHIRIHIFLSIPLFLSLSLSLSLVDVALLRLPVESVGEYAFQTFREALSHKP